MSILRPSQRQRLLINAAIFMTWIAHTINPFGASMHLRDVRQRYKFTTDPLLERIKAERARLSSNPQRPNR